MKIVLLFTWMFLLGCISVYASDKIDSISHLSQGKGDNLGTPSQKILKKLMADIRECDKSVQYSYDVNAKQVSPPELKAIKGFKFHKLLKNELSFFKINESYEGMHASMLVLGQKNNPYGDASIMSIYFEDNYLSIKERLESLWNVHFNETERPGPDDYSEGKYAESKIHLKGVKKIDGYLTIERMPKDVYPYIGLTEVSCDHLVSSTD